MNKQIKQILKDVYLIDQSLKVHEDALIKIIQKLLRSKPESKIDERFVQELRIKIVERIKLLNNIKPQTNMFNTLFNKKLTYALGGIVVVACVLIITNLSQENGKLAINNLGENAFGELSFSQQVQDPEATGRGGESFAGQDIGMVSPEMVNYNFIYTGDDFELSDGQITVYKTLKGDSLNRALSSITKNINLDVLDLNKFQNLKIGNVEISEDRDFGYNIYIDSRQNSLSINMNWEKWPREEFDVSAEMLADEELLSIADRFLSEYSINMDMYEKGEVMNIEGGIRGAERLGVIYENVSIIYPLKIDNQIVYDQGGQKYGMNVSVNLRHKRVANVYGIIINAFESSQYAKETNKDKIITFAENGGLFKSYIYPDTTRTLDLELGTPEISLVRMWMPSENKMDTAEILVPSLVFPVITEISEQTYFYRTNIVVPLVGELLDQFDMPVPVSRTFE